MSHILTLIAAPGTVFAAGEIASSLPCLQWQWLEEGRAADFILPHDGLDTAMVAAWQAQRIDHILQPAEGRRKQLLISDMDSTMIAQECIDELAGYVGLKDHVAAITERAMNGELDFSAALRERVALLKGLPETALEEVYRSTITLMPGARVLVQTMKAWGAYCLLVSGGFRFFTGRVGAAIGFDAEEANQLEVVDGVLTGRVLDPILDKHSKRESLHRAARERGLPLHATLAVGDGANDLPMLLDAGLGIAYHAKPVVQQQAKHAINHNDLTALLFAQGIHAHDWVRA